MHCLLPRPWNFVCKVQGCSFAQTTWGSEMLTALSLSRYPQIQQIFYNFGGYKCVCVWGGCIYKCRILFPSDFIFFVRLNIENPKKKAYFSLYNFCTNSWHNKVTAKFSIGNNIILRLPFLIL